MLFRSEKVGAFLVKLKRFNVLSHATVIGKLAAAFRVTERARPTCGEDENIGGAGIKAERGVEFRLGVVKVRAEAEIVAAMQAELSAAPSWAAAN